jgi:hypothetical protein
MAEVTPFVRQERYDDAMKQRAFLVWMWEADSDIKQTARILAQQEAADAAFEERGPHKTPNEDTLWRWLKSDDWPSQRHNILASDNTAGALYNHALGKHILLLDKASARHAQILDLPLMEPIVTRDGEIVGEKPSAALSTIYKAIEGVYTVARLIGRIEPNTEPPKLPPPREIGAGPEDMTTRIQRQQRRIAESKQRKRGKS